MNNNELTWPQTQQWLPQINRPRRNTLPWVYAVRTICTERQRVCNTGDLGWWWGWNSRTNWSLQNWGIFILYEGISQVIGIFRWVCLLQGVLSTLLTQLRSHCPIYQVDSALSVLDYIAVYYCILQYTSIVYTYIGIQWITGLVRVSNSLPRFCASKTTPKNIRAREYQQKLSASTMRETLQLRNRSKYVYFLVVADVVGSHSVAVVVVVVVFVEGVSLRWWIDLLLNLKKWRKEGNGRILICIKTNYPPNILSKYSVLKEEVEGLA